MITIELKDEQVRAALDRIARALSDLTPVMDDIGELLTRSTKKRFTEGTSPEGVSWAAKSQTTIDTYTRRKDPVDLRPLFGPSGRLSSEITHALGIDRKSVEIGSNMIYSGVMQFGAGRGAFGSADNGSQIPWGAIPARPYLGLSEADTGNIVAQIDEWLGGVAETAT